MDGLRWLLLLFGLLVVVGVYLYSRREKSTAARPIEKAGHKEGSAKLEPSFGPLEAPEHTDDPEDAGEPHIAAQTSEKIVTLRLVAKNQGTLAGDELALSLRGIGMRHGKFGIFHRYEGDDQRKTVFSAASLVEPGSFDLAKLKDQRFPGISLFMVLPGPMDAVEAFDLMMASARALAKALNAELLDETGSSLSIQRERYLREEIIQFQHGLTVA